MSHKSNDTTVYPSREELAAMGIDQEECGNCQIYLWTQLLGEWQPLDGVCSIDRKAGSWRADSKKCRYFAKRIKDD